MPEALPPRRLPAGDRATRGSGGSPRPPGVASGSPAAAVLARPSVKTRYSTAATAATRLGISSAAGRREPGSRPPAVAASLGLSVAPSSLRAPGTPGDLRRAQSRRPHAGSAPPATAVLNAGWQHSRRRIPSESSCSPALRQVSWWGEQLARATYGRRRPARGSPSRPLLSLRHSIDQTPRGHPDQPPGRVVRHAVDRPGPKPPPAGPPAPRPRRRRSRRSPGRGRPAPSGVDRRQTSSRAPSFTDRRRRATSLA